ncbi:MAG TPA: hypothetical protein VN039_02110 [Nitrospira sp.]|nr:hypothetical protein [Nitrospira sp.]
MALQWRQPSAAVEAAQILVQIHQALRLSYASPLFFYEPETNPQKRKAAAQQREAQRQQRGQEVRNQGCLLDACKQAEHFLQSRQPVDISAWTDERLNRELNLIADAFRVLEADPYAAY